MSDLTRVERLDAMTEGQKAFRAGQDTDACPYAINGDDTAPWAAAWLRGYVTTRNIDGGDRYEDKTPVD